MIRTAALICVLSIAGGAAGQLPAARPRHVTPQTVEAIERGVEYLVRTQSPSDGSWRISGQWGSYPTAMTALAGLA